MVHQRDSGEVFDQIASREAEARPAPMNKPCILDLGPGRVPELAARLQVVWVLGVERCVDSADQIG